MTVAAEASAVPKVEMPQALPPPNLRKLAERAPELARIFDDYGFPPKADLEHYCSRRLLQPNGNKLTFDAFAAQATLDELVQFYEQRLGKRGLTSNTEHTEWQLPAGSPAPERVLSIVSPKTSGPHQSCEAEPKSKPRSIVVLSKFD